MSDIVLGIDPGVSETGWAILAVEQGSTAKLLSCGVIRTFPIDDLPSRLRIIHAALSAIIAEHRPGAVAVEEMFFTKIAHTIRATLQARGVILLAAAQHGLKVSEYNPRTVKLTLTGSGSAAKAQMQSVLQKALGLAEMLRPDDVADAAAIALCHARSGRYKRLRVLDSFGSVKKGNVIIPKP
jgi:crossover junction endodeoxyribonuclease RuvC